MANDTRDAKLRLGVETKGVDKSVNDLKGLDRELDKLSKDLRQNFDKGINSVEALSDEIRTDLVSALKEADKAADGIDVKSSAGSGGGGAPAAAKFRGAASLIGGGEIVGLIDDLQDLGEGFGQLSGDMGKSATAALGAGVAFGVATAAIAVIGIAMKNFADEQQKHADTINAIVDAQRSVDQDIASGATSEDLKKRLEELNALREKESSRLDGLKQNYRDNVDSAGALTPVLKAMSGAEDALAGQIDKSTQLTQSYVSEIESIESALASGETAAADMKAVEEELSKQREKEAASILSKAQSAGQLVQAERRAMDASFESNQQRLESIEDEKAAIQAQIDVLRSSGSTAETVTAEIEKLNGSLDSLGKESAFIKDTALEASRVRDAEKKAAKEAEQNAEKAAAAQQKYADGIKNANTALKQATQDINTKLGQALADNLTGMFRDIEDLSTQFRRDTFDMDLKANQAERDAFTEHLRSIDDIRDEAYQSEREALQDGNFKEAFLARRAGQEALQREQRETQREGADRRQALADERGDLLRNTERTRADRLTAYGRANADAQTAAQRELQQAQVTRTRALEMNANSYKAELSQLGQFLQARNQLLAQANQAALAGMGGRSGGSSAGMNSVGQSIQQQMNSAILAVLR